MRELALISIGLAVLHIANLTVELVRNDFGFPGGNYGPFWGRVQQGTHLLYLLDNVLLLVAAIALLRWKPWSRAALLIWAAVEMAGSVVSGLAWFIPYASQVARTPTACSQHQPSVASICWMLLSTVVADWAFPLLVVVILRQPEVARLWARKSGGFEVVPMAQVNQP